MSHSWVLRGLHFPCTAKPGTKSLSKAKGEEMRGGRDREEGKKCGGKNEEDVRERRREAVKKQRGGMKD